MISSSTIKEDLQNAFSNKFISLLALTAIPTALQSLMASSRTVTDVLMTSQLGEAEVAAIGYSSRFVFILILAILGIVNGGGVIIAQYWGANSKAKTTSAYSSTLVMAFLISLSVYFITLGLAPLLSSMASDQPQVQAMVRGYLVIGSAMIIPFSLAFSAAVGMRSVGKASAVTFFTLIGLISNIVLNYILIFGKFGAPAMGVVGAAWASVISYSFEAIAILLYVHKKSSVIRLSIQNAIHALFNEEIRLILKVGLSISISSVIWAMGLFVFNILVAQMGTQSLAIFALVTPIESIVIAIYIGMSSASNVIVGHKLGANELVEAKNYSRYLLYWTVLVALATSFIILLCTLVVTPWFTGLSSESLVVLNNALYILSVVVFARAFNVTAIVGILRSGGDTNYAIVMDVISQWVVAIPLTWLFVNYFQFGFPLVLLAINTEEIFKSILAARRYMSGVWCRNLVGV